MFLVPKNTKVRVIREGQEWHPSNFQDFVTTKDNVFDKEEIVVDPIGTLGTHKGYARTVGGVYARAGWYGFKSQGWNLLVQAENVQYA